MNKTDRTPLDYAPPRLAPRERKWSVVIQAVAGDALVVTGVVAWGAVLAASRGVATCALVVLLLGALIPAAWALWRESRRGGRGRHRLALYAGLALALMVWGIARVVWEMVFAE